MLIVLLNILFYIIVISFTIELPGEFNILFIFINKFLKLIKLIIDKLINSVKN